ncbi:hypothetical protein DNTS_015964 [Danionella cerebrum]|uniref:Kelch domain-containing protein 3 n=1 Tax=Danionella cerebrum TaxID=2873325 RepID=A0A553RHH3_9TELE|nr:hypothetical protein DNTS_015964 [Danionella translucida]
MLRCKTFVAVSLRWTKLPPVRTGGREHAREVPYMRYGHTAVLLEDIIFIWGGRNDTEGACNVLYAFDVNQHRWFTPRISGTVPGARDGHSACILNKSMYIFGGYEQLQGTPARWRDFHSATMIGSRMFVFGGRADRFGPFHSNNEIYCNKIRVFDTESLRWLHTPTTQTHCPLPEGRRSHSAFAYKGELYIFGGYNARLDRHFNDLWKFNPGESVLLTLFILLTLLMEEARAQRKGPMSPEKAMCVYGWRPYHSLWRNQADSMIVSLSLWDTARSLSHSRRDDLIGAPSLRVQDETETLLLIS